MVLGTDLPRRVFPTLWPIIGGHQPHKKVTARKRVTVCPWEDSQGLLEIPVRATLRPRSRNHIFRGPQLPSCPESMSVGSAEGFCLRVSIW